jgi:hypothetical protein
MVFQTRILPGVGWIGSPLLGLTSFWDLLWCLGLPANSWVLLNPLPRKSLCNMMYRHPCILDCMHFVSYALVRKSFSYIHCSPWNAIYVFVILFGMMWLFWLSSWKSWFISMVDGYVFEKCHMYALLWVNAFLWSWHVLVAWLCLIFGWIAYFDHMGPKAHLPSWMLALLLYLVECHKFLFVTKTFHVSNTNLKMKCKLLGKCAPMSYVLNLNCFGC